MSSVNLAYLVPTIFALVLALYPAPWHLRTRNIATLSMIFWMTSLNLVHLVNCVWCRWAFFDQSKLLLTRTGIVWDNNVDIKAKVWGDISTTVIGELPPRFT
jgi:pheromone a factor receptor